MIFMRLGLVSLPDSRRDIYPCVILPRGSRATSDIRATWLMESLCLSRKCVSFCASVIIIVNIYYFEQKVNKKLQKNIISLFKNANNCAIVYVINLWYCGAQT